MTQALKNARPKQSEELMASLGSASNTAEGDEKKKLIGLMRDKTNDGKKTDVKLSWITLGINQRSQIDDVEELIAQIEEVGLLEPVGIQLLDGEIMLTYGHRRLKAFQALEKVDPKKYGRISAIIKVFDTPEQDRILAQAIENLGRADLLPLDECIAINETKIALSAKRGKPISNEYLGAFLGGRHKKTIGYAISIANWSGQAHSIIRSASPDLFSISVLRNFARKGLAEEVLVKELTRIALAATPESPEKQKKESAYYERPRHDQIKKFDEYLAGSKASKEMTEFVQKQKNWLWSKDARKVVRKIMDEHFAD